MVSPTIQAARARFEKASTKNELTTSLHTVASLPARAPKSKAVATSAQTYDLPLSPLKRSDRSSISPRNGARTNRMITSWHGETPVKEASTVTSATASDLDDSSSHRDWEGKAVSLDDSNHLEDVTEASFADEEEVRENVIRETTKEKEEETAVKKGEETEAEPARMRRKERIKSNERLLPTWSGQGRALMRQRRKNPIKIPSAEGGTSLADRMKAFQQS